MSATCTDWVAEPIRTGGDVHRCVLPAVHVFADEDAARWHACSCSARWVDDQQIDEARRTRLDGAVPAPTDEES